MKVVLDECVNRRLKASFKRFDVVHVSDVGLDTLKNGRLLREADSMFDAMITIDKNMPYQSSLRGLRLTVLVLQARNNSLDELRRFVPAVEAALRSLRPGEFVRIERPTA